MLKLVSIILSFVILLVTPIVIAPQVNPEPVSAQTNTTPSISPTPEEKLKSLNMLMGEHALIGGQLLIARYEGRPDYDEALEAVNENSQAITLLIGDFYGEEAEERFTAIWNRHINAFVNYADAKKNNDRNREAAAIRELQRFTEDLATLLARGNKSLFGTAQNYLAQHILGEKRILDTYVEENYSEMYKAMHESYQHATMMTDKLR